MGAAKSSVPHVVLIDNYDSFTWNVYEILCREGAQVSVYRNDEITIPEIEALNADHILISPGPGNPEEDAGISREVIQHFIGRLPIFGICMGLQCIVSQLGGRVESAGEIVHGKTSHIRHNNSGCFRGVSQDMSATRYHSLAASISDLPDCLEVTAKIVDSGIIQGVRHKEYIVEGVQFHPESILTREGGTILRNFLQYTGGKWADSEVAAQAKVSPELPIPAREASSILDRIYAQRKLVVAAQAQVLGQSLENLEKSIELGLAPKITDFVSRLEKLEPNTMGLIAEVKRASPSKGLIAPKIHAATQALEYAKAGVAAISVLTEPAFFKGTLDDLMQVRRALDLLPSTERPALLRKEFIFSRYQIAEARLAGADTVLLIVKMLEDDVLEDLYRYSQSLGMEPLVEVANHPEMVRAAALGSKVIGINNRDLHSFKVDMTTTSNLVARTAGDGNKTIFLALSGITGPQQVAEYATQGVQAVLVGESLMRADDTTAFAQSLMHYTNA